LGLRAFFILGFNYLCEIRFMRYEIQRDRRLSMFIFLFYNWPPQGGAMNILLKEKNLIDLK